MNLPPFSGSLLTVQPEFTPGDPAPDGYLAWHEWAEVQHKSGLRQVTCHRCGLWRYPQELSGLIESFDATDRRGRKVAVSGAVCIKCITKEAT